MTFIIEKLMNSSTNKISQGKVLVLGSDERAFLSVIRSLGRKNISVHIGWYDKNSPVLKSRYISKRQNLPRFSSNSNWKEHFINILQKEKYDLVIPCNDKTIIPLQLFKDEFEKVCKIYLLNEDIYSIANDKLKMQKLVRELGLNVPQEIEFNKNTNIDRLLSEFSFPVVIKPRSSFTAANLKMKNRVEKVFSKEEFLKKLEKFSTTNDTLLIQKNFIGKGVGIELLVKNGMILYSFQHIRIHEPLLGGGSSYRKSTKLNPELLEASSKIMKALNYTGVAMVEFKMDFETGKWVFIELNARFWGSLPLAIVSGADFPYYLYKMLTVNRKEFNYEYKKGVYCRNIKNDLIWFYHNLKANHSNPYLETVPLWRIIPEILNIILLKEHYDTFALDDMKPGLYNIYSLFKSSLLRLRKRILSVIFMRVYYRNKMLEKLKPAKKILFVCKGNICRSPFAHYYLKAKIDNKINISSCGYYPIDGRKCPNRAIEAAEALEINLNSHRSKIVTEKDISSADIIFTFDEDNIRMLCQLFPKMKTKIFRISSLDINMPLEIDDPYGQDKEYCYKIYEKIRDLIDVLLTKI
jgi:protein-tyrosine-phosphatase/predicted ATP-grasp superfamily ATP-dependent carboligase